MYTINEDQEALEVIARPDERINLEQIDIRSTREAHSHKGYAFRHLFEIERFVKDIEAGWEGGFIDEPTRYSGIAMIRELYLGKTYYRSLNDWIERYSSVYRYSARVELFYDVCEQMGLIGQCNFYFREPGEIARADGARYMDAFSALIEEIRWRCQSREFKERERLRLFNAKRNVENVLALEEAMFSPDTSRSRWLVLSLTLCTKPQFRRWVTPEMMQRYRKRFFEARGYNTLMSGIENYVWALEQGEQSGLHLHVILFYSGEHNHDEFIARQIGEYWVNVVTEGRGDYWNSNAASAKENYRKRGHGIGVGQIDWRDFTKREALRKNLVYLAKAEQYLMSWSVERIRTFDMGQVPKKIRAGRPRADVAANNACENSGDVELP
jgi:hypothetical protein